MILRWMSCALAVTLLASAGPVVSFPDTPAGRRAQQWLEAFNANDDAKARAFFESAWTAEGLKRRPVAERLAAWGEIRQELPTLTLRRVSVSEPHHLEMVLAGPSGAIEMTVDVEASPPHRITSQGLRVSMGAGHGGRDQGEPVASGPPITVAALRDSVAAAMDAEARADRFSGVVHLVSKGQVVFSRAVGFADRRHRVPNRVDTRFNLGSINKTFTRLAIEQLAEQGKLSLDDPVSKHLPEMPAEVARRITIRQVIDHRSGLGDFFGDAYDAADKGRFRDNADFLPLFRDQPLDFEPGSRQSYSNAGYVVLGLIVEKVSGQPYHDYVREHIFAPAGMKDTDSYPADLPIENVAMGYTRESGPELRENIYSRPARGSSAGGGYSTAEDLVRYAKALRDGKLGKAGTRGGMGIGGGAPGINAALEIDPERDLVLVVLANLDPPAAQGMAARVRGWARRAGL